MKLARKILLSSCAIIPATTIPMVGLTGCSTTWGYKTPFSIGGMDIDMSPYADMPDEFLDQDKTNIHDYIQTNYAVTTNTVANYAYSLPYKANVKDVEGKSGVQTVEWTTGSAGWYQGTDSSFAATQTYKDKDSSGKDVTKTSTNARNATLAANIPLITSIGTTIKQYVDYSVSYAISQMTNEEDLKVVFGSQYGYTFNNDWHGKKGGTTEPEGGQQEQNNKFYEFLISAANSHTNNKTKDVALLKSSKNQFAFDQNYIPIPSYVFNDNKRAISPYTYNLLTGVDNKTITQQEADGLTQYWTSKTTTKEDNVDYNIYTFNSVPVLTSLGALQYDYLSPAKNDSFLVNDYLINDKTKITNSIGSAWKNNLTKYTDRKDNDCTPHYKSFSLSGVDGDDVIDKPEKNYDTRIFKTDEEPFVGGFVCLFKYTVKERADGTDTSNNTVVLNSLENVFPAYFMKGFSDLFKKANSSDKSGYIINQDKVNSYNSKLLTILKREKDEGLKEHAKDLSEEGKKLVSLLGHLCVDGQTVNTNDLIFVEKF